MSSPSRSKFFGPIVAVALACAACASTDEPAADTTTTTEVPTTSAPPTTEDSKREPGVLYVPECDDASDCAAGFILDEVFYRVNCIAIRQDAVTSTEIGHGDFAGTEVTVNLIDGVGTDELVAFSYPGGVCQEGDAATSPWSIAYVEARAGNLDKAICMVGLLTPEQKALHGCTDEQPPPLPDGLSEQDIAEANDFMTEFMNAYFSNDPIARDMWSGYPYSDAEADAVFEKFLIDFEWAKRTDDIGWSVVAAGGFGTSPVVTVVDNNYGMAAAFVLSPSSGDFPVQIQRLPEPAPASDRIDPPLGSVVKPGDVITFSGIPVEGGARAYIWINEIENVTVDHETLTTSIVLPDDLPEIVVVTLSLATPELPGAMALVFTTG